MELPKKIASSPKGPNLLPYFVLSVGKRMRENYLSALIVCFSALFLLGCSKSSENVDNPTEKGKAIGKVMGKEIYSSEIEPYTRSDSANAVQKYFDKVALEQALVKRAEESKKVDMDALEEKVNQFKNSLIILRYQQHYLKEKLDTNVSLEEIKKYYEQNINSYLLDKDVFQGYYIKIPTNAPRIKRITELLASDKQSDHDELQSACLRYASFFSLESKPWQPLPIIFKTQMTYMAPYLNHMITSKQIVSVEKDDNLHLVRFFGFKFAQQPSPLPYVELEIKQVLLNKRKQQLLSQLNEELMRQVKADHVIEIY
jgi:hypothetical protein